MQKNNLTPSSAQKSFQKQPQTPPEGYNQIYDEEFVSLINSLNESIKEYYKVSKNNIIEANSILNSYEQQAQSILDLMNLMINTSSYNRLDELFGKIPKSLEVINQMKLNADSNNNNLNLFFDDAKILFKSMKFKRKERLNELNNQYNQTSTDSYTNSFHQENKFMKNSNSNNMEQINMNNIIKNNSIQNSVFSNINIAYSSIMKLLNGFAEFNYMVSKIDFEESNRFNNLQNSVKKELENFFLFLKKNLGNSNSTFPQNKSTNNLNENRINQRSKNIPNIEEIEKLKKIIEMNKKKLIDLTNQLNLSRKKNRELEMKNNNLNLQLQNAEQTIMNFQNNINNNNIINDNAEFNNALNQKDMQILNLQNQLKVFQSNENTLNVQINNINNQFKEKVAQYEYKISTMTNTINTKNKNIMNLKNEIENLKLSMQGQGNYDMNKNIQILNMEIKEKESKIKALNEEILNFQRTEKMNQKQIEELNNNIFTYENIIRQKDELINTNYKGNNDTYKFKKENELLKKQIEELKNANNNILQNQRLLNGNMHNYEMPEMLNQEYLTKINELNQEILNLKQTLSSLNESKN